MDNEINRLQQAKMFIDYLANGVDPVFNTDVNVDTLHNEQVISCFRYISDVLARDIYQAENDMKNDTDFFITDEQISELRTFSYNCKVTEITNEINRVTAENMARKMAATWINDWLEAEGFLCKSDLRSRKATEKGEKLGIFSEYRKHDNGNEYYINLHNEEAQRFIFNHIIDIIAYRNERYSHSELDFQSIEYPDNISVREFIRQQPDKCFVMSIGSCDSVSNLGSYISVLFYKGKCKVLKKSNISTSSSNKCILSGIIDAALAIKSPTDVVILSSTPLGFNTPKSKNHKLCQEICRILSEKECRIFISVCQGKGFELNSLIKSFA